MKSKKLFFHKSRFFLNIINMKKKKKTCLKSMKKNKTTFIKSSQQLLSSPKREFCLPDDCWEHVFSFIINPAVDQTEDKNKLCFKSSLSLSLVSKQFLSIIDRLIFSLTIYHRHLSHLPRFFHRFSNLNSLHLWFSSPDLDADIALALRDRSTLISLFIAWIQLIDANYITSLYIDSFVSLKGLNSLKFWYSQIPDNLFYAIAKEGLPLKTFVLENCTGFTYHGIYGLLSKCHRIQHLGLQVVDFLNNHHVSQLSLLLPDLVSINLSRCSKLTESALFAFIKNCRSLGEITMNYIYTARENVGNAYNLKDFDVNPHLKSLHFYDNSFIHDEIIILFASIFPNLELLDLSYCRGISEKGICQVLSRCWKVTHLHLTNCEKVRRIKMNFVVPQLVMLNLSDTSVDDETLCEISNSCCGLLKLLLLRCKYVTQNGVIRLVKKCRQLEEIDLKGCDQLNADVILSMLSSGSLLENDNFSSKVRLKF